jgi:hypothetical protein
MLCFGLRIINRKARKVFLFWIEDIKRKVRKAFSCIVHILPQSAQRFFIKDYAY